MWITFAFFNIVARKPASFTIKCALPPTIILLSNCDQVTLLKAQLKKLFTVNFARFIITHQTSYAYWRLNTAEQISSCKLDVVYLLKMTNILYILTTNFYFQTWHCYLVPWDENSIFLIIGMVTQCCHKLSDNFVGVAINKYNTNLQYK